MNTVEGSAQVASAASGFDLAVYVGLSITFALGVFNLLSNARIRRQTTFINTVTSERIKWIAKVRSNISELLAQCDQWVYHNSQERRADLQEMIEFLRCEVRLQLNPKKDVEDKELERLIDRLPSWNIPMTPEEFLHLRQLVISATQDLLKREWEKVKDESLHGDLRQAKAD